MLGIVGYSDKIYCRPGDVVSFKVSCESVSGYDADIVRLICGDDNPKGPGVKEIPFKSAIDGHYEGRRQRIHAGSYVVVPDGPALRTLKSFTVQAFVWPTTPAKGKQGIVARWSADGAGFALIVDDQGSAALQIGDGKGGVATVSVGPAMLERHWYRIGASYDAGRKTARVFQYPLRFDAMFRDGGSVEKAVAISPADVEVPLTIATIPARTYTGFDFHYNGKIDSPRLANAVLSEADCEAVTGPIPQNLIGHVVGAWDFSANMESQIATDRSPNLLHGNVVNFPTRAMTGWNWTGEVMDWKRDPNQWGAIHFHDDDVYNAGWETDFALTIPADMKSGLYAARLRSGAHEEYIPFAVSPSPGKESKVAFVLATSTYLAYGNDRLGMDGAGAELLNNILNVISPHELFLNDHTEYGGSLYDAHSDGSGICYTSRLRPLVNMRPKRQGTLGGFGHSKLWGLAADTHIIDWLESMGYEYDVLTDEELHDRGYQALAPYRVVIAATHPEYCSTEMWDSYDAFRRRGGRIMALGGDGWYWRVAYHPYCPGIMELRRAESGVRAWAAAPGEYFQNFDGRMGGLWVRLGKAPQSLVGVGFAAQGFDLSSYYERMPDSYRPDAAFIFDGVEDERIGDFGLIGGGAAGLEIDRAAPELGTPANALVVAQSRNLTNTYLIVPEEFLETAPGLGADENAIARADMVFFPMPGGGAVFSVGSMAWAGSLSHNQYENNVSRVTDNVLKRFLSPDRFDIE
jgi:N,N-dimethylformamidase